MGSHCFRCGLPFEDPHSIVITGGDQYHKGCTMEFKCNTCNKTIGFLSGTLESSNYRINCIDCSSP